MGGLQSLSVGNTKPHAETPTVVSSESNKLPTGFVVQRSQSAAEGDSASWEELKHDFKQLFDEHDKSKDGSLDREEFKSYIGHLNKALGMPKSKIKEEQDNSDSIFNAYDHGTQNSKISWTEFWTYSSRHEMKTKRSKKQIQRRLRKIVAGFKNMHTLLELRSQFKNVFMAHDADANATLDKPEYGAYLLNVCKALDVPDTEAKDFVESKMSSFHEYDTSGDGRISFEEFWVAEFEDPDFPHSLVERKKLEKRLEDVLEIALQRR